MSMTAGRSGSVELPFASAATRGFVGPHPGRALVYHPAVRFRRVRWAEQMGRHVPSSPISEHSADGTSSTIPHLMVLVLTKQASSYSLPEGVPLCHLEPIACEDANSLFSILPFPRLLCSRTKW